MRQGYRCVVFLLVFVGQAGPAQEVAAQCFDFDTQPRWLGSTSVLYQPDAGGEYGIVRRGDTVYPFAPDRIYTVDFADRAAPVAGDSVSVRAWQWVASGNHLFAAAGDLLTVVDICTPQHPVVVAELETEGFRRPLQVYGDYLFGASNDPIDISDPTRPVPVAATGVGAFDFFVGFLGDAGYLYRPATGNLVVLDLSDPLAPVDVGVAIAVNGQDPCLAFGDQFAVVGAEYQLQILDTSDPFAPFEIHTCPTAGKSRQVNVEDRVICQVDYNDLYFWDVSVLTDPVLLGKVNHNSGISDATFATDQVFVVDYQARVAVLDYSRCDFGVLPTALGIPGTRDFAFAGDVVISVASVAGIGSVSAFDLSDPAAPLFLDAMAIASEPHRLAVADGLAAVTVTDGLLLLDVSSPSDLRLLGHLPLPGLAAHAVELENGIAYLAGMSFVTVDVSQPEAPVQAASLALDEYAFGLEVSGGHAFVQSSRSIEVVAVSDPHLPVIVADLTTPKSVGMGLAGDRLFVGNVAGGFAIHDVSNPGAPDLLTSIPTLAYADEFAFAGSQVFVGTEGGGCQVFDRSSVDSPRWVGTYFGVYPLRIDVHEDWVYLADRDSGLNIVPRPCAPVASSDDRAPTPAVVGGRASVHPNPFNPGTAVHFELPVAQDVRVSVYDLRGRRLRTLADREFGAGRQRVIWDGKTERGDPAPSGVYFVRVDSEHAREVVKAALLK